MFWNWRVRTEFWRTTNYTMIILNHVTKKKEIMPLFTCFLSTYNVKAWLMNINHVALRSFSTCTRLDQRQMQIGWKARLMNINWAMLLDVLEKLLRNVSLMYLIFINLSFATRCVKMHDPMTTALTYRGFWIY